MIKKYVGGEFRPSSEHVKKDKTPFSPIYYYQYIQTNIDLGRDAVERFNKEERDVSALAVGLSDEAFLVIKEELSSLRKKMILLSEKENQKPWNYKQSDTRRVYQGVFQLFPITKKKKGK
jgi:uncharacterized protein (TIGR02147 family)